MDITLYQACDFLSMLGLKVNHVSKRDPRKTRQTRYALFVSWTIVRKIHIVHYLADLHDSLRPQEIPRVVAMELPHIMFTFPIRRLRKCVLRFVVGCPCGSLGPWMNH